RERDLAGHAAAELHGLGTDRDLEQDLTREVELHRRGVRRELEREKIGLRMRVDFSADRRRKEVGEGLVVVGLGLPRTRRRAVCPRIRSLGSAAATARAACSAAA